MSDSTATLAAVSASRVNRSLTANAERRLLVWMAGRAPQWLTSDQLTLMGFAAQCAAGLFFALARFNRLALLAVVLCIALNWLGDSLDGTLARVRNRQRPRYGFYVDHMTDIFGSVALMCGLAVSGFVHWQIALAMLIGFLVLASESFLATCSLSRFHMSQGAFGPTEIRILLIAGCVALMHSSTFKFFGREVLLFDAGGAIAAAGMLVLALRTAIAHTAQLYREEPL